jgi:hypothetical protein
MKMKILLGMDEFRKQLLERQPDLTDEQLSSIFHVLVVNGLGLEVQPDSLEVGLGNLKVITYDPNGQVSTGNQPIRSCDFEVQGFPDGQNITALSIKLDASSTEAVKVALTIFPFKLDMPSLKSLS